jgi:hypothetical protein
VPHERYRLVIREFHRCGHSWELHKDGRVHKARIADTLEKLIAPIRYDEIGRAIQYAYEHQDGLCRWCLRYPDRVLAIIAEANTAP